MMLYCRATVKLLGALQCPCFTKVQSLYKKVNMVMFVFDYA